MVEIVLITEDDAFATAASALAHDRLALRRVNAEDAIAVARSDRTADVLAVDVDSVHHARSLISAISLATRSIVVAISREAWPGSDAAGAWRRLGADAVLPKPSGQASPTLAGGDRDAFAGWFADLANRPPEGTT
jgi:esterase/lipase superfamily enzyme